MRNLVSDIVMRHESRVTAPDSCRLATTYLVGARPAMTAPHDIAPGVTLKEISDFPGYLIGDDGSVWTTKAKGGNDRTPGRIALKPRRMKTHVARHGYLYVNLDRGGKNTVMAVHRLVLIAFVGPCPDGMESCHYPDPDRTNNRLDNLRWDTHDANMKDKYRDRPPATEKRCRRCCEVKPVSEFPRDKRASDGLQGWCKRCHYAMVIASRDPDKKRAANREHMRRARASRKAGA
jgi:hypothetical protein